MTAKLTVDYENKIVILKAENKQLKQKLRLLEIKLTNAEKRCACFINNQKLHENKDENR